MIKEDFYWNKRAEKAFKYKKEEFYTITPIPYYYQRRKIILNSIKQEIHEINARCICDFGCGTGEYLEKLLCENKYFLAVDASENMVNKAKMKIDNSNNNVGYEISNNGIISKKVFDLIYSVAIWAHLSDEEVLKLYRNIHDHIEGGKFIICEQIAPIKYMGKGYIRRTVDEYERLLKDAGFMIDKHFIIDFPLHRNLFERIIAKKFVNKYKFKWGLSDYETRIKLNSKFSYKLLSYIFVGLSYPRKFYVKEKWGYCFIVATKK